MAARMLKLWVLIPQEAWMFVVCCQVEVSATSRVLPNVVRRCVRSRNLVNEEALAYWGAFAPKTNKI